MALKGYNSHGHYAPLQEVLKLERERGNYIDPALRLLNKTYKGKYRAIWVCLDPKDAVVYLRDAGDHDLPVTEEEISQVETIDLSQGILWTTMDDGDGGVLFTFKVGRAENV